MVAADNLSWLDDIVKKFGNARRDGLRTTLCGVIASSSFAVIPDDAIAADSILGKLRTQQANKRPPADFPSWIAEELLSYSILKLHEEYPATAVRLAIQLAQAPISETLQARLAIELERFGVLKQMKGSSRTSLIEHAQGVLARVQAEPVKNGADRRMLRRAYDAQKALSLAA
jgi:hypothetical protein